MSRTISRSNLTINNANYIAAEMAAVNSVPSKVMRVAFRNPELAAGPGTKWMNITQAQFKEIERILTLGNER